MPTELETPVFRLVWGHPGKAQIKKDQKTKQPILKDGKPVEQWVFGAAFEQNEFRGKVWPGMHQEIATAFPNGAPSNFSFKYKDGNTVDRAGKLYSTREGYANCFVLTVSTEAFAPPVYKWENGKYRQMEPHEYKCGDYFTAKLNFKANVPTDRTHTPGIFVNPIGLLHVGYGPEIVTSGGDPTEMFGAQPQQYQLPPGASATPLAPNTGVAMPGQMMQPQPGQMPMGAPQMQPAPMVQQPQPGYQQPAPGYVPPHNPAFTGGPQTMQPAPGGYVAPGPGQMQPMQQPGQHQHVQPAHDFVQNAGHQQPGGYAPQPGQMMSNGNGHMPGQPVYQPQPGQMPGMMPPNR